MSRAPPGQPPLRASRIARAIACSLALTLLTQVPAHGSEARLLGIQPFLSPPALFERYAPLRDWLAAHIGEPVRIESARTRDAFHRRLAAERYDLVITSPHVVPFLTEETGYRPVAATRDRLAIVVGVRPEAPFTRMEDLADARIAAPFEESLAAAFLDHTLSNVAWPYGSAPPTIRHHHHHTGATSTFIRGEAEALVLVTDGDLITQPRLDETTQMLMSLGEGTLIRVISLSPSFPGMTLLVNEEVLVNSPGLREQLTRLQETPQGREVLQKIRHRGFVAIEEGDYRPFRPDTFGWELPSMGDAMND